MKIGIMGAGIAGLSTAYFLREKFPDLQVHEASGDVGGLARSFKWHGFDCDLGPHRLFTNDQELLNEMLALVPMAEFRRSSRIFLRGKWIQDPVNAVEMVLKFFPRTSFRIVWHYLFRKQHPETSFESLVLNQFGVGLNEMFFKPYSEKLFGIPADQISPAWGRRKIRVAGLKDMLRRNSKLYFKRFYYPLQGGYGAMSERLYQDVKDHVHLHSKLVGVTPTESGGYRCEFMTPDGPVTEEFDVLVSSLALSTFAQLLGLDLNLRFRPARLTYLLVNRSQVSDNHWFYFADREFSLNRVAEFKNFANSGLPANQTVLCCEATDLTGFSVDRVIAELEQTGLLKASDVVDTKVIDISHAYPVYDLDYEEQSRRAEEYFAEHPNIHHVGRQAMFAHKDIDEIFEEAKLVAAEIFAREPETVTQ